jgi:archaellum component FlaC
MDEEIKRLKREYESILKQITQYESSERAGLIIETEELMKQQRDLYDRGRAVVQKLRQLGYRI